MKNFKLVLILTVIFTASCLFAQEKKVKPPKEPKKVHVEKEADSSDVYIDIPEITVPEINIPEIHVPEIKISQEQERKILDEMRPQMKEQMEKIKKLDKMKYTQLLMENQFRNFEVPFFGRKSKEGRERLKKITELDVQTEALGLEYQKADKQEKEKIRQELQGKLSELFELRESNRKEEVKELEDRLSELKNTLEERRKNKDKIIDKRLLDLTGEDETTEW
ncbi:MAG: hypothetical protein HF314_09790 [Ignavibacteria bacterium]|jgi:hypothetical protein|nr:hypothetical protein [Ignavibacteria bacterium]MCU7503356.1 hypothetical protein [Ignavibacteria bacterium]MCU7515698.1 hypothetical protein [Ignavibacteria bacterium]